MKKNVISVVIFLLAFSITALSQEKEAQKVYDHIEIEKFTVREGVELEDKDLSELLTAMVANFRASKRFVSVGTVTEAGAEKLTPRAKITGEITKFKKGNRATRYFIGFGAGATKMIADIKVIDAETGEVLMTQTVDGDISMGVFGGDSKTAKGEIASEIIKAMTKKSLARKKRL